MKFKIPDNYTPPSNIEIDEEFQEIVTLKADEDGNLILITIGEEEVPVEGKKETKPKTARETINNALRE